MAGQRFLIGVDIAAEGRGDLRLRAREGRERGIGMAERLLVVAEHRRLPGDRPVVAQSLRLGLLLGDVLERHAPRLGRLTVDRIRAGQEEARPDARAVPHLVSVLDVHGAAQRLERERRGADGRECIPPDFDQPLRLERRVVLAGGPDAAAGLVEQLRALAQAGVIERVVAVDRGLLDEAFDDARIVRPGDLLDELAVLLVRHHGPVERVPLPVHRLREPEQFHARFRLLLQVRVGAVDDAVDHLADRRRAGRAVLRLQLAAGTDDLEQEVARGVRAARLGLRALRLPEAHRGAGDQHAEHERRHAERGAVASHEAAQALRARDMARADRLAVEMAAQVFRKLLDRAIALRRHRRQRLGQNRIEIAAQLALQPARIEPADFARESGIDEFRSRAGFAGAAAALRALAAEQLVQHDGERIDVGGRGHGGARELLRRGVLGRGGTAGQARELGRLAAAAIVEQLGDAEVEQLHRAGVGDEDVRGLEIAVHDQPRMRGLHGAEHLREQRQPLAQPEPALTAVDVDRQAIDAFERQPGLALLADAGVVEGGDVRMAEAGEEVALALEPPPLSG